MDLIESTPPQCKTLILGGGLAGLAASIVNGAPIFEASQHVGGVAASDTRDGFTFDRGIHILQSNNAKILSLLEECGISLESRNRQAYIYSHGTYTAYPFQVNTAGLPLPLRIRCVRDFLRRNRQGEPRNYEEWMYNNLGKGFAETFLIPYSEKFWTIPPSEMTHDWTGNRVPQPTTAQVLRGAIWSKQTRIGTNANFRYPSGVGGYGSIAAALTTKAGEIHYGHRAKQIDTAARRVYFDNGASANYETLISTIPLPELVAICTGTPVAVREAAGKLRTNSIFVVNLGIGRPNISSWHWAHYPDKDVSFFRLSYPHNLSRDVAPQGASSISAEVAYTKNQPFDQERVVEQVIDDLIRVGALAKDAPIIHTSTHDIPYGYCIYDMHRKASVRTIRDWLKCHGIITAGRYGLWSYFWSDEAMMSGIRAADKSATEGPS